MSNPKGMVVKVLLAYGPDCDCSMAWLAGSRLAVSSARVVLEVRCLEQGLPMRGVRSRGVGVGP